MKCSARVVLLAFGLLLVSAGPASAASCWQKLLTDWYDGTIDKTYPIPCYHQAIAHLPTDVQNYSSARDDITRALQRAIAAKNAKTTPEPVATTTSTEEPVATQPTTTAPPETTPTTTPETSPPPPPATTSPGRPKKKGVPGAIDKLNPGDADSFPLPLLILGGLAILLVAAGIAGMIWRRYQGGRPSGP